MTKFNLVKEKNIDRLNQFTPIVDRVHGGNHPEFHEVRDIWAQMNEKIQIANQEKPELNKEFSKLREITDQYAVPGDVCESYEAVYNMLEEFDTAYYAV